MKRLIFTIAANNYMASALTLKESVDKCCDNVDFVIVLADKIDSDMVYPEDALVLPASELLIENYNEMTFIYDVVEFSTAIKPFAFTHFMDDYDKIAFFDPDTYLFDSIDEIWEQLDNNDYVLTPHIVTMNCDIYDRKESHILKNGVFNLGFLAIKSNREVKNFMTWWSERLKTDCIRGEGLFVDQKWVDYLPVFSDRYHILKSYTYNMADWNYHERRYIGKKDDKYYCRDYDGVIRPLKFYHFSGIKMDKPEYYVEKYASFWNDDEKKVLIDLIKIYQKYLSKNNYAKWSLCKYSYGYYDDGSEIWIESRRQYRKKYIKMNGNDYFLKKPNKCGFVNRNFIRMGNYLKVLGEIFTG